VGDYRIFETPAVRDTYKQASTELLAMLADVVYPALG